MIIPHAGYNTAEELSLLGMQIKYAALMGLAVTIVPDDRKEEAAAAALKATAAAQKGGAR